MRIAFFLAVKKANNKFDLISRQGSNISSNKMITPSTLFINYSTNNELEEQQRRSNLTKSTVSWPVIIRVEYSSSFVP